MKPNPTNYLKKTCVKCVLRVNFRAPILFHGPVELRSSQYEHFKVFYLIIILENLIKPAFEDDWKIHCKIWYGKLKKHHY